MKPEHNPIFSLVGRDLIASLFIPAGFTKLFGFAGTVNFIAAAGLPQPQLAAVIAVGVEIPLGLALLLGWQTRKVAGVLAAFTFIATMAFHQF
ncbi:MAG: DoxX family protein, partial [Betaproteobacteria bacterium]